MGQYSRLSSSGSHRCNLNQTHKSYTYTRLFVSFSDTVIVKNIQEQKTQMYKTRSFLAFSALNHLLVGLLELIVDDNIVAWSGEYTYFLVGSSFKSGFMTSN